MRAFSNLTFWDAKADDIRFQALEDSGAGYRLEIGDGKRCVVFASPDPELFRRIAEEARRAALVCEARIAAAENTELPLIEVPSCERCAKGRALKAAVVATWRLACTGDGSWDAYTDAIDAYREHVEPDRVAEERALIQTPTEVAR